MANTWRREQCQLNIVSVWQVLRTTDSTMKARCTLASARHKVLTGHRLTVIAVPSLDDPRGGEEPEPKDGQDNGGAHPSCHQYNVANGLDIRRERHLKADMRTDTGDIDLRRLVS
jgi:hypothetical protein